MNYPEETNGHSSEEGLSLSRAATLNGFEEAAPERVEVDKSTKGETEQAQVTPDPAPENPKEKPTPRLEWGKPLNKFALVLGGSAVVALIVFLFLEGVTKPSPKPAPTAELQDFPAPVEDEGENQEGKMRAEVALGDQAAAQEELSEKNATGPGNSAESKSTKPSPGNTVRSSSSRVTRPQRVAEPPQRVALPPRPTTTYRPNYASAPARPYAPPRAAYSAPSRPVRSPATPSRAETPVEQDPVEAWLIASQLGSYGGFTSEDDSPETEIAQGSPTSSPSTSPDDSQEQQVNPIDGADSRGTLTSPRSSAFQVASTPSVATPTGINPAVTASPTEVNPQEEAAILTEQPLKMLMAGTKAPGILTTPMIWDEGGLQKQLLVRLSEPLKTADNQVALKEGTHILTQVQSLSEAGLVRMVAVAALVEQGGQQVEVPLPQNAVVIQGKEGGALRAKKLDNKGPELARRDLMFFALGAVAKASELFTRPQESVSIFNAAGGSIAQTNPEPNILAGVLQGGSESLSEQLEERNDRAMDEIANRPNVSFLPAGTTVEVYASQTVTLDSALNESMTAMETSVPPSWLDGITFGIAPDTIPLTPFEQEP